MMLMLPITDGIARVWSQGLDDVLVLTYCQDVDVTKIGGTYFQDVDVTNIGGHIARMWMRLI